MVNRTRKDGRYLDHPPRDGLAIAARRGASFGLGKTVTRAVADVGDEPRSGLSGMLRANLQLKRDARIILKSEPLALADGVLFGSHKQCFPAFDVLFCLEGLVHVLVTVLV